MFFANNLNSLAKSILQFLVHEILPDDGDLVTLQAKYPSCHSKPVGV
jgi:hypothetical protein